MSRSARSSNLAISASSSEEIWKILRSEVVTLSEKEAFLANFLNLTVLNANSFADSVSRLLAAAFVQNEGVFTFSTWQDLLTPIFRGDLGRYENEEVLNMIRCDMQAFLERDPACKSVTTCYLHFKGLKALMSHRAAHILWRNGREETAYLIQSRCSDVWSVDIHPGAKLGRGLMLDHGTGVVIGETCVVGVNCTFLHGVTLGSSGKDLGDRHPKIGDRVLIGCGAMVLGNITIGNSAKIGSGSVVIKPIAENSTAVGNPARIVGQSVDASSAASMDVALNNVVDASGQNYNTTWSLWANGGFVFEDFDTRGEGKVNIDDMKVMIRLKFHVNPTEVCMKLLFNTFDADGDGFVTKIEFNSVISQLQGLLAEQDIKEQTLSLIKPGSDKQSEDNSLQAKSNSNSSGGGGGGGGGDSDKDPISPVYDGISVGFKEDNKPIDPNLIILEYLRKISESVEPSSFI